MKAMPNKKGVKMAGGRQPMRIKNPAKTSKRLLKYVFSQHKLTLIIALLSMIISSFASVYSASYIGDLVSRIEVQIKSVSLGFSADFTPIITLTITMCFVFGAGVLASLVYSMLMAVISQGVLKNVRDEMFIKMQSLPIKYFDTHSFGDTMSHFTNDTDALEQLISQSIPNLLNSLITIVVALVSMFTISWQLTLVVLATVGLMFLVIKGLGGKSAMHFVEQQRSIGSLNGYVEEMINGQKVVKVFCREEMAKQGFDQVNNQLCLNSTLANKYANIFMPIMGNLTYFQYAIVAVCGGVLAVSGHLIVGQGLTAFGVVASFLLLSRTFTRPINMVSQQFNAIVVALAGAERIFELMDEPPEIDNGYVTLTKVERVNGQLRESENGNIWAWKHPHGSGEITFTPVEGRVYFEKVDFSYDGSRQILNDISIDVKKGQKIAFVGPTGAGKTTITNLINRFYDIDDGKIRYDDININKIRKPDLRRSLGVVLQDVHLFSGSVMENIRYGKPDASDEEVISAAKLACADQFIQLLPQGYNTMLSGGGANLSQGQRQLISIARVAIADPPVMILDEATSSIDTRTESIVQRGMDNLMKGRTVFVIAHRLSTIKNADVIMVLNQGSIVERGNHEELLNLKGEYYKLYNGSFKK